MLLCLQETNGAFGPRVSKEIQELATFHNNIVITCTKSGRMDKQKMRHWVDTCLAPHVNGKSLLFLDSWDGLQDPSIFESNNCERGKIPPNITSQLQPLGKYFFRQYNVLRKELSDRIRIDGLAIELHNRVNVIKLHSIIHNQLRSPKFTNMIRFAWVDCGYEHQQSHEFQ